MLTLFSLLKDNSKNLTQKTTTLAREIRKLKGGLIHGRYW